MGVEACGTPAACPSPTPAVSGAQAPSGPWASAKFPSKELSRELGWVWGSSGDGGHGVTCGTLSMTGDSALFCVPFQSIPVHPGGAGSMDLLLLLLPQQTPPTSRLAWEAGPPSADTQLCLFMETICDQPGG